MLTIIGAWLDVVFDSEWFDWLDSESDLGRDILSE